MSEDLKPFFEAMQAEYMRHYPEKGDSWRDVGFSPSGRIDDWIDMDDHLFREINRVAHRYLTYHNPDELVDLSNLCAMLWIRTCKETITEEE